MNPRIARYLLRRLRREAERTVIDHAVEAGLLAAVARPVGDHEVRRFVAGAGSDGKSAAEIRRILHRAMGASPHRTSKIDVELEPSLDEHEGIIFTERIRKRETAGVDAEAAEVVIKPAVQIAPTRVADLLRTIRNSAASLEAVDVATLLLVAKALSGEPEDLSKALWALSLPEPIFLVHCRVRGFESAFLDLLKRGVILPGAVALSDGTRQIFRNMTPSGTARWHAVFFRIGRYNNIIDNTLVYRAARELLPIVCVNEGDLETPSLLANAAQVSLDGGHLTTEIIRETLRIVLGDTPPEDNGHYGNFSHLGLSDLAITIRPGVPAVKSLEVLRRLALQAVRNAENDNASGSGGSAEKSSGGSTSRPKARGKDQETGSDIIKPAKTAEEGRNSFIPHVETLSGYGKARDWALTLKADLALWREGELEWVDMSTKLLLSGPPGTGKTTFAKALCNSLQVPLISTSVANWLEPGYLGDVIKRMRCAFEEARAHAPSILFIDEFDGIGQRGGSKHYEDYWRSVVNRLLELLDGAAKSTGVIVVGATNNPGVIDPALLRSGRLETQIAIPLPDVDALAGIIRCHLRGDLDEIINTAPKHKSAQTANQDIGGVQVTCPILGDGHVCDPRLNVADALACQHINSSGE